MAQALADEYRRVNEARTVDYYNTGVLGQFTGIPVYHREGRWYVEKRALALDLINLAEARSQKSAFPIFDITDVETGKSAQRRWPERTWEHIERGDPTDEGWEHACYFCGEMLPDDEALQAHEDDCSRI